MELTAEQRDALDVLPPKRRAFVLFYVGESAGNGTDAARRAGYKSPEVEACRMLKDAKVRAAIAKLSAPPEQNAVASIAELREMWSKIARGEMADVVMTKLGPRAADASLSVRMKATELLGKSQGAFLDRTALEGGGADRPAVQVTLTLAEAKRIAKGGRR